MKPAFLDSKDFWTGIMFLATGLAAMFLARSYPFGTTLRMGPGYFPIALSALLTMFGLWFVARGVRSHEKVEGGWSIRALIVVPLALILFGLLVERAGFVPALTVLIFGSAAAGTQFKLGEVALLTALLTALCVAVFIWGLGLPYPLFAGF
jgi:putative tricarboxylic transport membrane protein